MKYRNREQLLNWICTQSSREQVYHDHKETMAWVVTALFLTGSFYAGFKLRDMIPNQVSRQLLATGVYLIATFFSSYLIAWQFNNRWIARQVTEGLMKTFIEVTAGYRLTDDDVKYCCKYRMPNIVVKNFPQESRWDFFKTSSEWPIYGLMILTFIIFHLLVFIP